MAQDLYPGGSLVTEDYKDLSEGAELTRLAIESGSECIFRATFVVDGLSARVDVLSKGETGWILDEVKASSIKEVSKIPEEKIFDVAFQLYVLRKAGLEVERVRMILVNTKYVWDGGEISASDFLGEVDITARCEKVLGRVETTIQALSEALTKEEMPEVELNTHCKKCIRYDTCFEGRELDIVHLPRISPKDVTLLRAAGVHEISQIPEENKFNPRQERMRQVVTSGTPTFSEELAATLDSITFPALFLDYESTMTAFPLYENTRPYQQICFQWSAHLLASRDADPIHFEYLPETNVDPRKEFCSSLWELVRQSRTLVHYHHFERVQMKSMADDGIPYASELLEALETRFLDLEKVIHEHVCFREFMGRTSIKVVLPVLVPGMSYKEMLIGDGLAAGLGFRRMLTTDDAEEAATLRSALRAYCCQDTLAMVEIYKALLAHVG